MFTPNKPPMQWYRMDLHLHTPASQDYQEPYISYLDILRRAEARELDIIAFTDHNTVGGYAAMMREVDQLEMLAHTNRITPEERPRLAEYRRLLDKILVLPGFEFTATLGFHVLGIFSPRTRISMLEHILLNLNIPAQVLEEGNSIVGASSDVLTAYRTINNAGGLVIAAHVNSTHGVMMRGYDFGGQTKIAYTQDPYLHALEVTDLGRRGRFTTETFFNGLKNEYPRRMRCVQGSDAHRLSYDQRNPKNLGIGDRPTEVLLPERTYEALRELLQGNDFMRSRPFNGSSNDYIDRIHAARQAGADATVSFHESLSAQGGRLYAVTADVAAMANNEGGTIFVGLSPDITMLPVGVPDVGPAITALEDEIRARITPMPRYSIDVINYHERPVLQVEIDRGQDTPYLIDNIRAYVRDGAETILATRDQLIALVQRGAPAPQVQVMPREQARNNDRNIDRNAERDGERAVQAQPQSEVPRQTNQSPNAEQKGQKRDQYQEQREQRPVTRQQKQRENEKQQYQGNGFQQALPPDVGLDSSLPYDMAFSDTRSSALNDSINDTPNDAVEDFTTRDTALPPVTAYDDMPLPEVPYVEPTYGGLPPGSDGYDAPYTRAAFSNADGMITAEAEPAAMQSMNYGDDTVPAETPVQTVPEIMADIAAEKPKAKRGRKKKEAPSVDPAVADPVISAPEAEAAFEVIQRVATTAEPVIDDAPIAAESVREAEAVEIAPPHVRTNRNRMGSLLPQKNAPQNQGRGRQQQNAPQPVAQSQQPQQSQSQQQQQPGRNGNGNAPASAMNNAGAVNNSVHNSANNSAANSSALNSNTANNNAANNNAANNNAANDRADQSPIPRTGVEIVGTESRRGEQYHIIRDLRNPAKVVKDVTRSSARKLWLYAVMQKETNPAVVSQIQWIGNVGVVRYYKRGETVRYDLALREGPNKLRVFYGVTEDGMRGAWMALVRTDEPTVVEAEELEQI